MDEEKIKNKSSKKIVVVAIVIAIIIIAVCIITFFEIGNNNSNKETTTTTINTETQTTEVVETYSASSDVSFVGNWTSLRPYIEILEDYTVNISWGSSAEEHSTWSYKCFLVDESHLTCTDGERTDHDFSTGSDNETVVYTDGTADFYINEGILTWVDNKENQGAELEFTKSE